jgi:hypothetical protein
LNNFVGKRTKGMGKRKEEERRRVCDVVEGEREEEEGIWKEEWEEGEGSVM